MSSSPPNPHTIDKSPNLLYNEAMARVNPLVAFVTKLACERLGISLDEPRERELYPELGEIPDVRALKRKAGSVTAIIGARDMGKSVVGYRLMEILGRPQYAVSPEQRPPRGITRLKFTDLDNEPPPFSSLFLDDIAVHMSSRDYTGPDVRQVEKLFPMVRHERKLHLISAAQLASIVNKYVLDADLVILKAPSIIYKDIERQMVKTLQDRASQVWAGKSDWWLQRHCYVITRRWEGIARVALPSKHPIEEEPSDAPMIVGQVEDVLELDG